MPGWLWWGWDFFVVLISWVVVFLVGFGCCLFGLGFCFFTFGKEAICYARQAGIRVSLIFLECTLLGDPARCLSRNYGSPTFELDFWIAVPSF